MNDNVIKAGLKNMFYTFSSQLIAMILSFISSFVLPFVLGVREFGYWQIYLFYTSYLPLFYFGFNDGIYLRYGNKDYDQLPYEKLRASNKVFFIIQFIIIILGIVFIILFEKDINKKYIYIINILFLPFAATTALTASIFLFTNRIKIYTIITVLGKILLLAGILIFLFLKIDNYKIIIIVDQVVKIIIAFISIYFCKEIFWGKSESLKNGLLEFIENTKVGVSLMIAMLAGSFLLGIGRIFVEKFMSIEDYGIYSFALSSTNIALVIVTSVGVIVYPTLKRLNENKLPSYFKEINNILCSLSFLAMLIYYPIFFIVDNYINKYTGVLKFLYILFPLIYCQSKMQILINTYYKILRKEKIMLYFNIISIILFILITVPIFYFLKSSKIVALITLIVSIILCYGSEIYLKLIMKNLDICNIVKEIIVILLFLLINACVTNIFIAMCLYIFIYLIFVFTIRKEIEMVLVKIKKIIKN